MTWMSPAYPVGEEAGRELAAHFAEILGHRVLGIARTRGEAVAIARTKSSGLVLYLQSSISSGAGGQR
jgi:hypothetical protein